MPILENARHELFAQQVASGKAGAQAWLAVNPKATYESAAVTANRTLKNANVLARVAELQAAAVERTGITAQMILERAWQVAQSDAKDRGMHLAIAAKAFPEFKDGITVNNDNRTLIVGEQRL